MGSYATALAAQQAETAASMLYQTATAENSNKATAHATGESQKTAAAGDGAKLAKQGRESAAGAIG